MTYFISVLLAVLTSLLIACSSMFMKRASKAAKPVDYIKNIDFWLSQLLLCGSMFLQLWLHRQLPYTVMMPLLAISNVWTALISVFILKEKLNLKIIAGICLILGGTLLLTVF